MSKISLSGVLLSPTGEPAANALIRVVSVVATKNDLLRQSEVTHKCGSDGSYSFDLMYGRHSIEVKYTTNFILQGILTVNDETSATTISELLEASTPPTDANILEFRKLRDEAVSAANDAKNSAGEAGQVAEDIRQELKTASDLVEEIKDPIKVDIDKKHSEVIELVGSVSVTPLTKDSESHDLLKSRRYALDASSGAFTVVLPAIPNAWDSVSFITILGGGGAVIEAPTIDGNGVSIDAEELFELGFLHHMCEFRATFDGTRWFLSKVNETLTDITPWSTLVGDWDNPIHEKLVGQHCVTIPGTELGDLLTDGHVYFSPVPENVYTVQLSGKNHSGVLYQQFMTIVSHDPDDPSHGRVYARAGRNFEEARTRGWLPFVDLPFGDVFVSGTLRALEDVEVVL